MDEIKSRKNPLVVHLKKLCAEPDYRREHMEFVCDGEKLLHEAVINGAEIKAVMICGEKPTWMPKHIPLFRVDMDIIQTISPLKNPQNIIFSCAIPKQDTKSDVNGFCTILEGIQDPGNVGTIIRTAAAFNVSSVILTGSCADPYNPKTIRATMGAIFKQRISSLSFDDILMLKTKGLTIFAAALGNDSSDIRAINLNNCAVVIGNEGSGISNQLLALCDKKIIIPMAEGSESLNAAVAAAIIMWEAAKGNGE